MIRGRQSGNVQEGGSEVDVEDGFPPDGAGFESGATDEERHLDVHVEGEGLALDEAELPQVVAVVRCVEDVRVLKLVQTGELVVDLDERGGKYFIFFNNVFLLLRQNSPSQISLVGIYRTYESSSLR